MTTTTSFGNWTTRIAPYNSSLEFDVAMALDTYNPSQTVLDTICRRYREAINAALPPSVSLCGNDFIGPAHEADYDFDDYPITDEAQLDLDAIVSGVDFWAVVRQVLDIAPESKHYTVTLTIDTDAPGTWYAAQAFRDFLAQTNRYAVTVVADDGTTTEHELGV